MAYKNVGKPTFLFCIFRFIVTLPYGCEHCMKNNLKGELAVMDSLDIKPNYAALGRKYGMDWRTVKKYHNGYEGRPDKRNKGSKLDEYRNEIKDKLAIKRITIQWVYQFMLKKYGVNRIGPFSKWSDIFQEPVLTNALLDRLLHHCSVININVPSYRLKDQMQYMIEEN